MTHTINIAGKKISTGAGGGGGPSGARYWRFNITDTYTSTYPPRGKQYYFYESSGEGDYVNWIDWASSRFYEEGDNTKDAYRMADDSVSTVWIAPSVAPTTWMVDCQDAPGGTVDVVEYKVRNANRSYGQKSWTLEKSDNAVDWTVVDTQVGQILEANTFTTYAVGTAGPI